MHQLHSTRSSSPPATDWGRVHRPRLASPRNRLRPVGDYRTRANPASLPTAVIRVIRWAVIRGHHTQFAATCLFCPGGRGHERAPTEPAGSDRRTAHRARSCAARSSGTAACQFGPGRAQSGHARDDSPSRTTASERPWHAALRSVIAPKHAQARLRREPEHGTRSHLLDIDQVLRTHPVYGYAAGPTAAIERSRTQTRLARSRRSTLRVATSSGRATRPPDCAVVRAADTAPGTVCPSTAHASPRDQSAFLLPRSLLLLIPPASDSARASAPADRRARRRWPRSSPDAACHGLATRSHTRCPRPAAR